ncbi:MAG TPA: dethiobiotin synthase [Vicinamibacterales bacterium]|nr:dethiobiotin synthase [Vicinamibacterales bacterium]
MRDLLVTGTDTGVGKTMIAAALLTALRRRGVRAVGFKPAETGLSSDTPCDSDLLALACGEDNALARPLLQLSEPLAPAVAAERAGLTLEPDEIEARICQLRADGYAIVVEGAGGVMVPLAWNYTVLDLAQACDLDAVVVARAGLGTLNHVAMTVMMLRSREIPIRGIVLNGRSAQPDLAESTNPAVLGRMLHGIRVIEVPIDASGAPLEAASRIVSRLL